MLRNGRRSVPKRNIRNTRSRNNRKPVPNYDDTFASDSSSSIVLENDANEHSSNESVDESLILGRGRPIKKRSKSKPENNKSIKNSNRSQETNTNEAGPSSSSNNFSNSHSQNRNGNKRKYREWTKQTSNNENLSSDEDTIGRIATRPKSKRVRRSDLDTEGSESSGIFAVSRRRHNVINSGSSSSASDEELRLTRRRYRSRQLSCITSDDTDSSNSNRGAVRSSPILFSEIRPQPRLGGSNAGGTYISLHINDQSSSSSSIYSSSPSYSSTPSMSFSSNSGTSFLDSEPYEVSVECESNDTSKPNNVVGDQVISSDSDSSDTDGEKCAICLKKFRKQRIGNPSDCDHSFCVTCLEEWSKSSNTCPVDRSTFDAIVVRNKVNGNVLDRIEVQPRNMGAFAAIDIDEVIINDETIICEICGSGADEESLLLCDMCNFGYHMACLIPPLHVVPQGSWFCPPCTTSHNIPNDHLNEVMRIRQLFDNLDNLDNVSANPLLLLSSSTRRNRNRTRNNQTRRPGGPPPRGRGPTLNRRLRNHNSMNFTMNIISSALNRLNRGTLSVNTASRPTPTRKAKKSRKHNGKFPTAQRRTTNRIENKRVTGRIDDTTRTSVNSRPVSIVDMVFPTFNLFDADDVDDYADDATDNGLEGEVAIMARVRSEYSARRIENRKNMVSNLLNDYQNRITPEVTVPEEGDVSEGTSSLLESILESQTLWHSKNVEISSKKDGKLEIKLKEESKKPNLSNTNHSSKKIPLFPNKNESSSSDGKSYSNNTRYSNLAGSSSGGSNSFPMSSGSFNSLNPSTRPGFSNILGNSSSALDLSPFRGTAPIRFRMNPPRPAMRRPNFNSNSLRHSSNSASTLNSNPSPRKTSANASGAASRGSGGNGADEEVDLYEDIENENVEPEKIPEMFSSLEPPPEPPALLMGSESSSDEDNGLVIDDKDTNNANKSNIYDPNEPNEDSDTEDNKDANVVPGYLRSPSYGGLSEFGPHLPLPEPPALPIELDSVNNSEEEDEAECPNMTIYSSASINLANNVQDIPIPDSSYPSLSQEDLEFIPIPSNLPGEKIPLPGENAKKTEMGTTETDLYSPTAKEDSETSSSAEVEEISSNKSCTSDSKVRSRSPYSSSSSDLFDERSSSDEETKPNKSNAVVESKDKEIEKRISLDRESDSDEETKKENSIDVEKSTNLNSVQKLVEKLKDDCETIENSSDDTEMVKYSENVHENDEQSVDKNETSSKKRLDEGKIDDEKIMLAKEEEEEQELENVVMSEKSNKDMKKSSPAAEMKEIGESNVSNLCLLPSDDLDPVSDVEYNDFADYNKHSLVKDRRKKRRKTRKREASPAVTKTENRELEEGEIEDDKSKKTKRSVSRKYRRSRSESEERLSERKQKRKRDRRERGPGKENKESTSKNGNDFTWKKLSKSTKERNYRDSKPRPDTNKGAGDRSRDREALKAKKEKRKEIERYDVRKVVSDKPRTMRDEFGRDISMARSRSRSHSRSRSRSRSRSVSPSRNYSRRSKGNFRRSCSQEDRWIDWSPVWTQRRSRSRTRRSRSRSRNRSRLSGDRYRNRSRNRDYDKQSGRKRRRSLSSTVDRYSPAPASAPALHSHDVKKRRRSKDRARKSTSFTGRTSCREIPEYFYDRSWSRTLSYASLTPEPEPYVNRYECSPSIVDNGRLPMVSSDAERDVLAPNPQNLTVIVPNVDLSKKKHKKKKDGKKKKKKQPSKEVFTSGDNIVVSVNFDDNQKIISAKSSKRKHEEEKTKKKKKDESMRKKRKQTLQVSEEVLNAKPVAVIDLNSSPCKEMSPTEVISLTDSGDENNANEAAVVVVRRSPQQYSGSGGTVGNESYVCGESVGKPAEQHRPYVMTSSGPKTPPEPPIKFTVSSTVPLRSLQTNPIFEQDEMENEEESMHYNKGPNTPPEPSSNEVRRSVSPNTTMYDPFEPTKSRSQSPENTRMFEECKETVQEERRPANVVVDMFADDGEKCTDNQTSAASSTGVGAEGTSGDKSTNESDDVVDSKSPSQGNADEAPANKSPAKEMPTVSESSSEMTQSNNVNTLVLDLSNLGDDYVPKSSVPLVKTSQGKYEFQSGKTADKSITVVIAQQTTPVKLQPQQVMVTPTRQVPAKAIEPIKQPMFPDILPWKLPPPLSQPSFSTPSPVMSTVTPTHATSLLNASSKSAPSALNQNGAQDESTFELDDSPYSPASSEGDDLFEPPPLNVPAGSPRGRPLPAPIPAVNSYKSRVDALFTSSPIKKVPSRATTSHPPRPVSTFKPLKKVTKAVAPSKKEVGIKADEEQLKILDDVPNSAVEMIVKEKFLKKLHRQERVVEEVKVVLKPHYAKKHITKEEYKDILRRAVPKICHNKSGDINPSKIQSLVEAYVKKIRHSKKKGGSLSSSTNVPLFPSMTAAKPIKKQKTLWG